MRLSVVIPARDAHDVLKECLDSVLSQDPPPSEVIVVDDGSLDSTSTVAQDLDVRVVRHPEPRGPGAARNTGASVATGDVLGFVDSDDRVRPGWAAALIEAFEEGATVAASTGEPREGVSLAALYPALLREDHGPGPIPGSFFVGGTMLAIRRDLFLETGGFDERLLVAEDLDLSFRLALAGHTVTTVPGAVVTYHGRDTFNALLRQRMTWEYWNCFVHWKYQSHPLLMARYRHARPRIAIELAVAAGHVLSRHPAQARFTLLRAAVLAARRIGELHGWLDLVLLRRRPPEKLAFGANSQPLAVLPSGPSALIVGDSRTTTVVARGIHADGRFAAPPPGLALADRWDAPPPWSRRLVRDAKRLGWRLPLEVTARRIEWEQPTSYGEAVLALHGMAAWLGSKADYAVAASGRDGASLAQRWPNVPVVDVDRASDHVKGDLEITRRQLRKNPAEVAERLSGLLGLATPQRVAIALRLADMKSPL